MVNNSIKTKIHNRFDIHVEHGDGTVDKYTHYNIVLDNAYKKLRSTIVSDSKWTSALVYGTGTGEMDASRTTLFNPIGSKGTSTVYSRMNLDNRSGEIQLKITIEPHEHVGQTLTEIGIGTTSDAYTHSLIKDSFGNPIAIHKTDTDKIIIYATVYAELFDADDIGVTWLSGNILLRTMLGSSMSRYGKLTLTPTQIEPICAEWTTGDTSTTGGHSTGEDGFTTQSISLDINSYNGYDIRSLAIGGYVNYPGSTYHKGFYVPIKGPNFDGILYQNQRIGMGNGEDTVFKIPTDFRGVKDCIVKVDNRVVEVKKNMIHGNNKLVGNNSYGEIVKVSENMYAHLVGMSGSSSNYSGYGIRVYEYTENGRFKVLYTKRIGTAEFYYSSSDYKSSAILVELNLIAVKNTSGEYEIYEIEWETGKLTNITSLPCGSTTSAIVYAISGTRYFMVQNTSSSSSYKRTLYTYENKVVTQIKDLSNIPGYFNGPDKNGNTLKGDYYYQNKLYKFDTTTLEFKLVATLPFTVNKGIVIAPFTIAEMQDYPGDTTDYQQLIIKKCNSSWDVTETLTFLDKFPKYSNSTSAFYLKDNIFLISSHEPHIVTFNPDTNEILYRKCKNNLTSNNPGTGYGYKRVIDVPNSDDFTYMNSNLVVQTEQEVGSIEFSQPVPEGSVITIDFTLDYVPKNNSLTATFTNKFRLG